MSDENKIEVVDAEAGNAMPSLSTEGKISLASEILDLAVKRCNPHDLAEVLMTLAAELALDGDVPMPFSYIMAQQMFAAIFERSLASRERMAAAEQDEGS